MTSREEADIETATNAVEAVVEKELASLWFINTHASNRIKTEIVETFAARLEAVFAVETGVERDLY